MTSRRLLLVGLGVMGRPYLTAAHAAGVSVIVLDSAAALASEDTQALLSDDDVAVPVGGGTDEHWYLAANEAVATYAPDGVLAFAEPHVRTAALIADEFGLPGPGLRAAEVSRNKAYQRALFARHEVAQPAFGLATEATEAAAWVAAHTRLPRGGQGAARHRERRRAPRARRGRPDPVRDRAPQRRAVPGGGVRRRAGVELRGARPRRRADLRQPHRQAHRSGPLLRGAAARRAGRTHRTVPSRGGGARPDRGAGARRRQRAAALGVPRHRTRPPGHGVRGPHAR